MRKLLSLQHLVKRYGPSCGYCEQWTGADAERNACPRCGCVVALNDVSLTLYRGEAVGLVGEPGSGKSTLLNLVDLSELPDGGLMTFHEHGPSRELTALDDVERQRLREGEICRIERLADAPGPLQPVAAARPSLLLIEDLGGGDDSAARTLALDYAIELNQTAGLTIVLATFDLEAVRELTTRTVVLRHGQVVESGLTDQILEDPQHLYTQQLLMASR